MKRKIKVLLVMAICLLMLNFTTVVFAGDNDTSTDISGKGADDIINAGTNWLALGKSGDTKDETEFAEKLVGIGQVLVAIGIGTILIVGAIMAIQWLTATPDKQAKLKQQLIGLVISVIVIFGAVGIWNVVRGIMGKIESSLIV